MLKQKSGALFSWKETQRVVRQYKLPLAKAVLAKTEEEAVAAAKKLSPAAMKIISPDIAHKSDIGGVITEINCEEEAGNAFRQIMRNAKKKKPKAKIEGILVQKMERGVELVIGAKIDATFGPVVMFGAGGVMVETLKDVAFRVAPVNKKDAVEMIKETAVYELLKGSRRKKYSIKSAAQVIAKASKIIMAKKISELDFNPVIVNSQKAEIADIRLIK